MLQKSVDSARADFPWESPIARTADLRTRSSSFDRSVSELHRIVSVHQAYLEDLRTETRSGSGRALAATLSVPTKEFDAAISDLKTLGRVEAISEAGEDSAVKLATAERHLTAAQTNLSRLQKLQRERKGELRDAVALEKDIAQANEIVAEAQRQHESLLSTVAQAHIHLLLMEDYRAPLETNLAGSTLAVRNSFVEGVSAIFSSLALVLGVLFEFGLPLLFWAIILFWPMRAVWRRFRHPNVPVRADNGTI
jgi:VIT1/CCC1 family predicted Fe2+/Mn2+ transporter